MTVIAPAGLAAADEAGAAADVADDDARLEDVAALTGAAEDATDVDATLAPAEDAADVALAELAGADDAADVVGAALDAVDA